jgi:FMN phosphatase YigB (HAD superfamily)
MNERTLPDATPSGYAEVRTALAAGVRLLTSDVFDTLVWRPVSEPRHLWPLLGQHLLDSGFLPDDVTPLHFADVRVRAEARARIPHHVPGRSPETSIEEIWAEMPAAWLLGRATAELVNEEIAFESRMLRRHEPALTLLREARQVGVKVVLVSDTYLSAAQLRDLLARVGVGPDHVDDIVTSRDHDTAKADGLLKIALERSGVPARSALHIGDNEAADGLAALDAGMGFVHLAVPSRLDVVAHCADSLSLHSAENSTDGGRAATARETLLRRPGAAHDPAYQFGAAIAGPAMAGFAAWASVTTERLGAGALHCLLREGGTIAELVRRVRPNGPEPVEMHSSRWGVLRASVITGSTDELYAALARRADFRPEHVTEAFGVDLELVRSVVADGPHDHRMRSAALADIAAHDELRGAIVESSARLRRGLEVYLQRTLRVGDGPIVLCDIGWSGMIQQGLTRVIRGIGIDAEVVGLYCALTPAGEERVSQGARMLGYLPSRGGHGRADDATSVIIRNPEILERVMTPPTGTLLSFTEAGEPVCKDTTEERHPSLDVARDGLLDYATVAATTIDEHLVTWVDDTAFRIALEESVAAVLRSPDRRLAEQLGQWHHDDVAGTASEVLAASWFERLLPFANAHDLASVPMTDVFWLPGLAAVASEPLAAQLRAVQAGASSELLCPPNRLGIATITAYPQGSLRAAGQWRDTPRTSPEGWSLVTMRCTVPSLRSVVVQPCESGGVVEFGIVGAEWTTADGATHAAIVDDLGAPTDGVGVRIVSGRLLGSRTVGFAQGGHLLVTPPSSLAASITAVRLDIAYRGITLDKAARRVVEPPFVRTAPRRVAQWAKARLRGPVRRLIDMRAARRSR